MVFFTAVYPQYFSGSLWIIKPGCRGDDVGEEDCGGRVERQLGSWVWCVWCGERLCHGAVGAQQCAGLSEQATHGRGMQAEVGLCDNCNALPP